jgi:hypothetical protein
MLSNVLEISALFMGYNLIYLDIFFNSYFFERFFAGNLKRILA